MDDPLQTSVVDTGIKEIRDIDCIEASPVENIAYAAGCLKSDEVRKNCPVVVIDLLSNDIKCRSHEARSNPKMSSKRGTLNGSPV